MRSGFKHPIRPRQMSLDAWGEAPARRSRKKTGRHSEDLMGGELLTTAEAAAYMRISPHTLHFWRSRKQRCGPRYLKVHAHAVRYRLFDVEVWLESRLVEPVREARRTR